VKVKNSSIVKSAIMAVAVATMGVGNIFAQGGWNDDGTVVRLTTTSDKVGIGTTSPGTYKLNVTGAVTRLNGLMLGNNNGSNTADDRFYINWASGSEAYIRAIQNVPLRLQTNNGSSELTLLANGNVGIGTPQPSEKLHILGTTSAEIRLQSSSGNGYIRQTADRLNFYNGSDERLSILNNGYVGIGIPNPSTRLCVNGTIRAREVIVTTQGWPDRVFKPGYDLKPLHEVEKYIKKNSRLEGIPSEKEVMTTGVPMGEMQAKLLQKLEETTLYLIEMKKENEALKARLAAIEQKVR
jgi:hypothetical protein